MIGRTFDNRYEIQRKIGSGGMAEVYLAHDEHLERDVALKVLSARYAEDDQFIERFRREASNAAGLNHSNIVQIYDRGEAEGTYYIAMEYLQGRSLKEIIVKYAPLDPRHIFSITGQILEALGFAHRKGIVHRDIKPQNILVDDEGRVKVTDFGIARAASASRMTDTGSIVGTAQYLSPEQAQGTAVEAPSDLYSLGVVMYEMATGRLPFEGDNPVAIAMKHVHEAPEPPSAYNEGVTEGLERIILRSLAKDPAERYQDAGEFLGDLRRAERGDSVAPPPAFEDQTTRVMGGGLAATAARTSETMVRPQSRVGSGYHPHEEEPEEERRGRGIWPWLLVILFVLILGGAVWALVGTFGDDVVLVDVPDVVGLSEEEAETQLEAVGLELNIAGTEESDDFEEPGTIVRQEPEPDRQLAEGEAVDVWLLAEAETVIVPDVRGMTVEEARLELGQEGLRIDDIREQPSDDIEEGLVIEHTPEAGEEVELDSAVTLIISTGPETEVELMPDLIGRSESYARGQLEARGLGIDVIREAGPEPEGQVIAQNPGAGTEVEVGSTVTITVSSGPAQVGVPDVIGESEEAARNLIRDEGLRVEAVTTESEAPPGQVIDQNPAPGTSVQEATTVTIWVSIGAPTTTRNTATTTVPTPATTTTVREG